MYTFITGTKENSLESIIPTRTLCIVAFIPKTAMIRTNFELLAVIIALKHIRSFYENLKIFRKLHHTKSNRFRMQKSHELATNSSYSGYLDSKCILTP